MAPAFPELHSFQKCLGWTSSQAVQGSDGWTGVRLDQQPVAPDRRQTANLEYFDQIFRQRYQTPETLMMQSVQELHSRQQQQEESVDDYCTQMLKLAKIVQVKDDLLLYTLLNGLRPEIATYVTQRGPKSVNELLTAARTAEITITPSKDLSLHAKVD